MAAYIAKRQVRFRDTDAAGIMHFSVFSTYMEEAEHEFLRSLGRSVKPNVSGGHVSWPRVAVRCDFKRPLKFEQDFEIHLSVSKIGQKSVTYSFDFVREQVCHAQGEITVVCCWIEGSQIKGVPIPEDFLKLLAPFVSNEDSEN